jgi:hypothetical protein
MRRSLLSLFAVACALVAACAGRSVGGIDDGADGGGARDGSAPTDGAPPGDGGKRGTPCTGAPAAFELTSTSGSAYCVGATDCNNTWLTLLRPDGSPLTTARDCIADCDECLAVGCTGACPQPYNMPAGGLKGAWNGTHYIQSACGAERMQCALAQCAPAGKYIARMCVRRATSDGGPGGCQGVATPTCVEVPFEWPATGPVRGVVN